MPFLLPLRVSEQLVDQHSNRLESYTEQTCKTLAPACRNCKATSPESMPPIPSIGKPGNLFAIAEIALRAIGLNNGNCAGQFGDRPSKWQCMLQAATLPSLTDSTVVSAVPAKSPPQNTPGKFDLVNGTGAMAAMTSLSHTPEPKADITKLVFRTVICSSSSTHRSFSFCSVRQNCMPTIFPYGNNSHLSSRAHSISSGTALMPEEPLRNTTKTRLAPQRSADVAQSKAVSPAPKTMTLPHVGQFHCFTYLPRRYDRRYVSNTGAIDVRDELRPSLAFHKISHKTFLIKTDADIPAIRKNMLSKLNSSILKNGLDAKG
uniref:Uncharacterized protein n=1 Tax=Glossina palpalis gambiensis TaxID=67801 RepID=A0A1B0B868_9MUSC